MPDFLAPLAVVCHDAGATQLVLPWLDGVGVPMRAYLEGPAARLWAQRFGTRDLVPTLDDALRDAAMLVSGTSLSSDLEHRARVQARRNGIPAVGVIDHWVDYGARFQRDGTRVLPDQIWVTDAEAFALALHAFPGRELRLHPNLYLREQVARIAPCPDPRLHQDVLYVAGPPAGADADLAALDYLVAHAGRAGLRRAMSLRIRPDEADPPGRYADWLRRHARLDVALDDSPTLAAALDRASWVAGREAMAMVVALAAGRRVVCALPPGAPPCRLPQRGLIRLNALANAA